MKWPEEERAGGENVYLLKLSRFTAGQINDDFKPNRKERLSNDRKVDTAPYIC